MLTQEETQRSVGLDSIAASDQSNSLALAVREDQQKFKDKDRPVYTQCKMTGHTVDKCYKIHGYSSGYKFKTKPQVNAAEGSNSENGTTNSSSNITASNLSISTPKSIKHKNVYTTL